MKCCHLRTALFALVALAPLATPASATKPVRFAPGVIAEKQQLDIKAIGELESARFTAMVTGDISALEKILSDDVTYSHSTGVVETKSQFLTNLKEGKTKYLSITPETTLVRGFGDDTAIITGKSQFHIVATGRDIQTTLVHTSVYRLQKSGWQLVAWHSSAVPPDQAVK